MNALFCLNRSTESLGSRYLSQGNSRPEGIQNRKGQKNAVEVSGASAVARTYVNPRTVPRVLYIFDDVAR